MKRVKKRLRDQTLVYTEMVLPKHDNIGTLKCTEVAGKDTVKRIKEGHHQEIVENQKNDTIELREIKVGKDVIAKRPETTKSKSGKPKKNPLVATLSYRSNRIDVAVGPSCGYRVKVENITKFSVMKFTVTEGRNKKELRQISIEQTVPPMKKTSTNKSRLPLDKNGKLSDESSLDTYSVMTFIADEGAGATFKKFLKEQNKEFSNQSPRLTDQFQPAKVQAHKKELATKAANTLIPALCSMDDATLDRKDTCFTTLETDFSNGKVTPAVWCCFCEKTVILSCKGFKSPRWVLEDSPDTLHISCRVRTPFNGGAGAGEDEDDGLEDEEVHVEMDGNNDA